MGNAGAEAAAAAAAASEATEGGLETFPEAAAVVGAWPPKLSNLGAMSGTQRKYWYNRGEADGAFGLMSRHKPSDSDAEFARANEK